MIQPCSPHISTSLQPASRLSIADIAAHLASLRRPKMMIVNLEMHADGS